MMNRLGVGRRFAQRYDNRKQYPELLIANYDTAERARCCMQLTLFDKFDSNVMNGW